MRKPSVSRGLVVLAALALAVVAACAPAAPGASAASLPTASAAPEVVLDAYLRALVAGDCDTGRKLVTTTFVKGNGELCGDTQVSAYRIQPEPARPSADEAVFATTLTTSGTADRAVQAGDIIWFYSLDRQPDGSWRIVGGGSGP